MLCLLEDVWFKVFLGQFKLDLTAANKVANNPVKTSVMAATLLSLTMETPGAIHYETEDTNMYWKAFHEGGRQQLMDDMLNSEPSISSVLS